jgi:murein DD-endopeptidase MepM/ murein hydrolase activator NlpD
VAAANDGKVAFADNLGIYGNSVILDHGLGVFTLYGHLSSIGVTAGQTVRRGDTLGRTGETGLAAGDHLHFSVMIDGVHVDPVEWWDPQWLDDHVVAKMKDFEGGASSASASSPKGRGGEERADEPAPAKRKRRR